MMHNGVTVEAVSTKFDKYSIMVGDTWYSTKMEYASVKPSRGDVINFEDGGKKYMSKVKIVGAGAPVASSGASTAAPVSKTYSRGGFPIDVLDGTRSIIRQNSLGHAVNMFKDGFQFNIDDIEDTSRYVDNVIDVARKFEAYSAGDIDRAEAEEAINKLTSTEG